MTKFRRMKRDKQHKGQALVIGLYNALKQAGHIVNVNVDGEVYTNADFDTVDDLALHLADLNPGKYSYKDILIAEC